MTNPTPHGQVPAAQGDALSDAVRVPLDSLHADAAYLIGRLREGSMPYARVIEIIRERIDAASPTAQAASSAVLKAIREANMQLVRTGDNAFMLVPYKVATAQAAESVPVLPDFDTVEQHIYGACRRYITRDMLEPIHNLIRDAIDADRAARGAAQAAQDPMLECSVQPRPLSHPLTAYHSAMSKGPLHYTWQDKPHRLVYDLIAAVKHYANQARQAAPAPVAEDAEDAARWRTAVDTTDPTQGNAA